MAALKAGVGNNNNEKQQQGPRHTKQTAKGHKRKMCVNGFFSYVFILFWHSF